MRRPSKHSLLSVLAGAVLAAGALSLVGRDANGQGAYVPPRTPDGKPDLQGIWQVMNTADVSILDHSASSDGPAGNGVVVGNELPYKPEAMKTRQANYEKRLTADSVRNCFLPGVPRATYLPFPFQILQAEGHVIIVYEYVHAQRLVYTDGSPHRPDLQFYMGDSRGHWEGNTLVVDVTDLNDMTWFDRVGNYHSEEMHVVERYTKIGPDHMRYEATIEDPKVFTRPWKMEMMLYRHKEPNAQVFDYQCFAFDHDKKGITVPLARMAGPKQ
jgi:hypothetical protein